MLLKWDIGVSAATRWMWVNIPQQSAIHVHNSRGVLYIQTYRETISMIHQSPHANWRQTAGADWIHTQAKFVVTQIARFMGPTWGPPGPCRPQMDSMLAPWTLLLWYSSDVALLGCGLTNKLPAKRSTWGRHDMETASRYWCFVKENTGHW